MIGVRVGRTMGLVKWAGSNFDGIATDFQRQQNKLNDYRKLNQAPYEHILLHIRSHIISCSVTSVATCFPMLKFPNLYDDVDSDLNILKIFYWIAKVLSATNDHLISMHACNKSRQSILILTWKKKEGTTTTGK